MRKKLGNNRPVEAIIGPVQLTKDAQEDLIVKHDYETERIEYDEAFELEEKWLEECQESYLQLETSVRD